VLVFMSQTPSASNLLIKVIKNQHDAINGKKCEICLLIGFTGEVTLSVPSLLVLCYVMCVVCWCKA
jgi:hypothetical protein